MPPVANTPYLKAINIGMTPIIPYLKGINFSTFILTPYLKSINLNISPVVTQFNSNSQIKSNGVFS